MDVARWEELGPQAARLCSLNDKFPSIYKRREMGFLEDEEKKLRIASTPTKILFISLCSQDEHRQLDLIVLGARRETGERSVVNLGCFKHLYVYIFPSRDNLS